MFDREGVVTPRLCYLWSIMPFLAKTDVCRWIIYLSGWVASLGKLTSDLFNW